MTTPEGSKTESVASRFGLQKIIKESTHKIADSALIWFLQLKLLVMKS